MSSVIDHRIAERRRQVREDSARRRLRKVLVVLGLLLGATLAVWLLQSPWLSIRAIEVEGAHRVDVDLALRKAGVSVGLPTIKVDADTIDAALRSDPWVRDVRVRVAWPGTVEIDLVEHRPVAWVESGDGWVLMAPGGAAVSRSNVPDDAYPVVTVDAGVANPGTRVRDPAVVGAVEFLAALSPELTRGVAVVGEGDGLWATLPGNLRVRLGRPVDMAAKATVLEALLEEIDPAPGTVIDLLAPGRPAVRAPVPAAAEDDGTGTSESGSEAASDAANPEGP